MAKLSALLDCIFAACVDQGGYFSAADIRSAKVSDADLFRLVGRGDIERVNRGVYRLVRFPSNPHGDLWAAALWAQPAVLSHMTALRLHELTNDAPLVVAITVPSDGRLRKELPALYRLHAADVSPVDRAVVSGLPVTSVRRTILDLFVEDEVDRELLLDAVALAAARGLLTTDHDEQLRALLSTRAPLLRELLKLQADHQRSQKNARRTPHALPVKTVADGTLTVTSGDHTGTTPLFASLSLSAPHPEIQRALIVLHGALRDADAYYQLGCDAIAHAHAHHTILSVPQCLVEQDVAEHDLDADTLRWPAWKWIAGELATKPGPISSFIGVGTLLAASAARSRFPKLREIVIAGHSGGAQFAQRYAILGSGQAELDARGILLRYVLANASSYVYFDETRPREDGSFAAFERRRCPKFNTWKYGLEHLPAYASERDPAALETRYARRDVTYLLGTLDTNPSHPALDRSCPALVQGSHRYARGRAYGEYLWQRNGDRLAQHFVEVPGVGHDSSGMFTSEAGLTALFGAPVAKSAPG